MILTFRNPLYVTFFYSFRQIYLEFTHEALERILRQAWRLPRFWHSLLWIHQHIDLRVARVVLLNGSDLRGSSCPFCLIFKVHLYVPSPGVHLWWSVLCNTSFVWVYSASTCPSVLALYFCLITWPQSITS